MARLFLRAASLAAAVVFSFFSTSALAQTSLPVEAYFSAMGDLELSPDGRYISMIQPREGRTALVVYPIGGGEPNLIEPGNRGTTEHLEVSNHFWSGDRIIISVNWNDHYRSTRANFRLEQTRLLSVLPDGRDAQVLFESRQDLESGISQESDIVDTLPDEEEHILVALRDCQTAICIRTVHKVNINTGRSVIVARGGEDTFGWATDSDGQVLARIDNDDGTYRIFTREQGSVNWREIMSRPSFGGHGQTTLGLIDVVEGMLYLRSNHEGRVGIYRTSAVSGGEMERLFLHDTFDAGSLDIDYDEDTVTSVSYMGHTLQQEFYDEEAEADHNRYNRFVPGEYVNVIEENDDENLRILAGYGPGDPTIYYLMDDEAGTINEIGQQFPQLHPGNVSSPILMTYNARDGLEIPGYLFLPPGQTVEDGPFPLVLYPHGGPNARDNMMFGGTLRQYLAGQGYAVFQPQFRGSRGFGNEFMRAGFEEWGGAMQDDLTDGVQFLIDQGIADSEHMCIVGWSYSAYAAVMGAIKTPNLFNCAAGINGVYDLPALRGELTTSRAWASLRFWGNTMGENEAELARVSPARRADEIQIPVLILASEEDQTAPYEESQRMIQALRQADRDFDSHIYEYGNHSLDYRPSRIDAYERMVRFLEEHM